MGFTVVWGMGRWDWCVCVCYSDVGLREKTRTHARALNARAQRQHGMRACMLAAIEDTSPELTA